MKKLNKAKTTPCWHIVVSAPKGYWQQAASLEIHTKDINKFLDILNTLENFHFPENLMTFIRCLLICIFLFF